MKLNKLYIGLLAGLATFSSCSMDDLNPEGNGLTSDQVQDTNDKIPSRAEATLSGMFAMMGKPGYGLNSGRDDDFGYIMACISLDLEGADMWIPNSGFNWFSVCGEYTSRFGNYANPLIRYGAAYNQIKIANEVLELYPEDSDNKIIRANRGQAKVMRAIDYLLLAPYFQFTYEAAADKPCVPLVTEKTTDFSNNPRATVAEVYDLIIADCTDAIALLEGFSRVSNGVVDKTRIDQHIAYGVRARAYLNMGKYAEAAADAEKALAGYPFATLSSVSTPSFYDMNDANWMWAINIDASMVIGDDGYATSSSWLTAFSSDGYAAACQVTPSINNLLYDKISPTDVRKGWWLDTDTMSPLLNTVSWDNRTGIEISRYTVGNVKDPYLPYNNVKFGMKSGVGSNINNNDWCLMRAEEMLLIQVEGLAKSGNEPKARTLLSDFVKTYRDPSYTIPTSRTFENEIWFQRRVELWGEGFGLSDIMRLQKPDRKSVV